VAAVRRALVDGAVVVVVDAEHDPGYAFVGLAGALRVLREELSKDDEYSKAEIRLHLDLAALRPRDGRSGGVIQGELHVGDHQLTLVYAKSGLVEGLPPEASRYGWEHPDFPQQTTADQFFDPDQFAAYLALGEKLGEGAARCLQAQPPLRP
jgi:hypothetical protein